MVDPGRGPGMLAAPLAPPLRSLRRVDRQKLFMAATLILEAIGENPQREGLAETPRRFASMWAELAEGIEPQLTRFPSEGTDQMVLVEDMPVFAVCEHHLAPFWGTVTVAYIPRDYCLGLSKFARAARYLSLGVQVQERLAQQLARTIAERAETPDVAVTVRGSHLCMLMRGARSPHRMTSSVMLGAFREEPETRAEFFALTGRRD